jgi:hypothetical protein
MEVCLVCGRDYVSVVRCTHAGDDSWWLLLRCGGCGTWHETLAPGDALRALRQATAQGLETMSWQVDAFSHALELDLIDADDF